MGAAPTDPSSLCRGCGGDSCLGGEKSADAARPGSSGLIQRYRDDLRARHCARPTWAPYPREMDSLEVNSFLTHQAVDGRVIEPSQNRRCQRCCFFYQELLGRDLDFS